MIIMIGLLCLQRISDIPGPGDSALWRMAAIKAINATKLLKLARMSNYLFSVVYLFFSA